MTNLILKADIDSLHRKLASKLDLETLYPRITWSFSSRFTTTYGQAEFGTLGSPTWNIKYSSRHWLLLKIPERRNLITHEFCHLAVEYYYGNRIKVLPHGKEWRTFMFKCGEDPDMKYWDESLGPYDVDILKLSDMLFVR